MLPTTHGATFKTHGELDLDDEHIRFFLRFQKMVPNRYSSWMSFFVEGVGGTTQQGVWVVENGVWGPKGGFFCRFEKRGSDEKWVFPLIGVSQNGWFVMENPIF